MKTSELIPLIDGDVLLYRAGFAVKEDEPTSHAIYNVKHTIQGILSKFPNAPASKIYLSGKYNFRDQLATIKPYKGNRKDVRKPRDYDEMREYLIRNGANVTDWIEADDALGIEQSASPSPSTVICSIDKDLDMIPGYHYNWVKDNFYFISTQEGNINFFRQMLIGDTSDNIPGIDKVGPKTTDAILDRAGRDLGAFRNEVQALYQKQYGDAWRAAYEEVGGLLWIMRKENERCPILW